MATQIYPTNDEDGAVTITVYVGHILESGTTYGERRRIQITTPDGYCTMTLSEWAGIVAWIKANQAAFE
jgi:hypothetical protein